MTNFLVKPCPDAMRDMSVWCSGACSGELSWIGDGSVYWWPTLLQCHLKRLVGVAEFGFAIILRLMGIPGEVRRWTRLSYLTSFGATAAVAGSFIYALGVFVVRRALQLLCGHVSH